jgi:lipopolysaccharide export system permease protein
MKTYIKFLTTSYLKSLFNVFIIMLSLVFILNILSETEFLNNTKVSAIVPVYLSLMSAPSIIFEMFPFIFLLATQFFFIKFFNNNEIQIFKYSGLKNSKIIAIIGLLSFLIGIIIITLFYSFSSNLQSYYLKLKNNYSQNDEHLAVITKNGLWIKDIINQEINIINASKIDQNYLTNTFITKFDKDYNLIKSIKSDKIDINNNIWLIYDATVYQNNKSIKVEVIKFNSNFDQDKIENLFSNLSSLSILRLIDLRNNYKSLNYSLTEIDIQIQKILSYPIYLTLMTIFSSIIMFNTKSFKNTTIKISIGLSLSVIIYYINNFFNVMGVTEKLPLFFAVWTPLILLLLTNLLMIIKINEK